MRCFNLGPHDLVRFTGPDAVRFLNGQLTQDVRLVSDPSGLAAFSCVTDVKARIQFRVVIASGEDGAIQAAVPAGLGEALEARLTRYLIADDAHAEFMPAAIDILHFPGIPEIAHAGVLARRLSRYGEPGTDWWVPAGTNLTVPDAVDWGSDQELEDLRISRGIPAWGKEIVEGMLPPEARLEATDISFHKGCYIGQEVISRIKSAGKVNRLLTRFEITGDADVPGAIHDAAGVEMGVCTSISGPNGTDGTRFAIGYLRRNAPTDGLRSGTARLRVLGSVRA